MLCLFLKWYDTYVFVFFFFFSSRRRHTRLQGDWSSDVCSSDLNIEIADERDIEKRILIARECLKALGNLQANAFWSRGACKFVCNPSSFLYASHLSKKPERNGGRDEVFRAAAGQDSAARARRAGRGLP